MRDSYILAIDQGTTGSRAFLYDHKGNIVNSAYQEFKQYYPRPGWVEHDPEEIFESCLSVIRQVLKKATISAKLISAIGITNQRETTVVWDRKTSKPLARAIVWQCRRTENICQRKKLRDMAEVIRKKTGLVLDPYFSATKMRWFLENISGLKEKSKRGDVCFGTIDSWLIWKLTGGQKHVTDRTNASRTMLYNIKTHRWDKELCHLFQISENTLPEVQDSGSVFGHTATLKKILPSGIPITAVLGDQQSALYGQGCFDAGMIKNTYGTGCFLVLNTGKKAVFTKKGLLTTVASDEYGKPVYALEGAVFIAGAVVQWLRDELKIIKSSSETEAICQKVGDNAGVYFVPAFTGLGTPHWDSDARGTISGLTRGANRGHIVRAAVESIAFQSKDMFDVMRKHYQGEIKSLSVDGGACMNNFLMQFQSDLLNCTVVRPKVIETTVQGAAFLAGHTAGLWKNTKELRSLFKADKAFRPKMTKNDRNKLYQQWTTAVKRSRSDV